VTWHAWNAGALDSEVAALEVRAMMNSFHCGSARCHPPIDRTDKGGRHAQHG
jgi:hypothetical protein